ncbi:MAG: 16S rRNA (guanine(966)-N(2))-methyltransferase RsmD [Chlamydiota bacterium]
MRITAGRLKNRRLLTPKGKATRPTTEKLRQAVFNSLQSYLEDSHFLDLFAGSGAMGLEALSRGAATATFVEKSQVAIRCIRANITDLQVTSQARLLTIDVATALKRLAKENARFTIIYADPPYGRQLYSELLSQLDTTLLLADNGVLLVEQGEQNGACPSMLHALQLIKKRKVGDSSLEYYVDGR